MIDWQTWLLLLLAVLPLVWHGLMIKFGRNLPSDIGEGSSTTEIHRIDDVNLPGRLRRLRDQRLSQLQKFRLSHVHNEKCCRRGTTCYSSHYLSECGQYLFSDCLYTGLVAEVFSRFKTLAAVRSVCEDGTVIETSSHKSVPRIMRGISKHVPLYLTVASSIDPEDLMKKHKRFVDEKLKTSDSKLMVLLPEMIPDVEEYVLQLVDQFLYERGLLTEPPQPLNFAQSVDSPDRKTEMCRL